MAQDNKEEGEGLSTTRRQGFSLRFHILALLLIAIVPAMTALGFSLWQSSRTQEMVARQVLQQGANSVASAVHSEIRNVGSLLQTLATTNERFPNREEMVRQYNKVAKARQRGTLLAIGSNDTDGVKAGIPPAILAKARTLNRVVLSDMYKVPGTDQWQLAFLTKAPLVNDPDALLVLLVSPEMLGKSVAPPNSGIKNILVALTDGQGRLIGRSRDPEKFVGSTVPDWGKLESMRTPQGTFFAKTAEGGAVVFAFQKLPNTPGWSVVVGEPQEQYLQRQNEPLRNLLIASGIAIGIALLASLAASHLILRPISQLVKRGQLVAKDDPAAASINVPNSSVIEFQTLYASMNLAEKTLRERAENARRAAEEIAIRERDYRAIAEVSSLVFWRRHRNGDIIIADGWSEFTGRAEPFSMEIWNEVIHPDDVSTMTEKWAKTVANNSNVDHEFRVLNAQGEWYWVRSRGTPVPDEHGFIMEWIGVLEDIHERRKAEDDVRHMALHDALTGLPNRVHFNEKLEQCVAEHKEKPVGGAVLCIDLDRFKEVNDTLGHSAGDLLLVAVTERLRSVVGKGDVVARLGGDEFVVLQKQGQQPQASAELATHIIQSLNEPYDLHGQRASIGASIGIQLIGSGNTPPGLLMQQSDMALYHSKESGRQQFAFFESRMDAQMQERRLLEIDLRRGISAEEFDFAYQPIFEVSGRSATPSTQPNNKHVLVGFEALLRWNHPERGVLLPHQFLALAEELSLVMSLGQKILNQACKDCAAWPEPLKVAVNVSHVQLYRPGFVEMVQHCLESNQLASHRLELEISEASLIRNPSMAFPVLSKLKALGVRIVMDHFGSGISSLGHLRSFPFDKVKIDTSFVQTPYFEAQSTSIITAIANLCGNFNVPIGAQGIETQEQLNNLPNLARFEVQGHFLGRPTDLILLEMYLAAHLQEASVLQSEGPQPTPNDRRKSDR